MTGKNKQVYSHADKILVGILALALFFIYMLQVSELKMISIIGDEFGYWASGSFLAGFDWSDVASYNAYYSYGYGIWLYLILKIAKTSALAYKLAMILNTTFMVGTFILLVFIGRRIVYKYNSKIIICGAFALMLFSGIYFSAHTSQCEAVLLFFFTMEIELLFLYLDKASFFKIVLLWGNTIYLYTIHQRMLVIIIALLIVMFIDAFLSDRKKIKYFFTGVIVLIALFLLTNVIKNVYLEELYQNGRAVVSNNYSGQVGKIQTLLSLDGIRTFLMGVLGKFFYLGVTTFGLFYYGCFYLGDIVFSGIRSYKKGQQIDKYILIALFFLLTVLGAVGISTIQLLDNTRIDTLIYGRYTEYLIPVICEIGLVGIVCKKRKIQNIIYIIQLGLAIVLCYQLKAGNYSQLYPNNIAAIGNLYYLTWNKYSFMTYVAIGAVLFGTLLVPVICSGKKNIRYGGIFLLALIWLFYGYSATGAQLVPFYEKNEFSMISDILRQVSDDGKLYYYTDHVDDTFAYLNADYIQFLAYHKQVEVLDDLEEADISDKDILIVLSPVETKKLKKYMLIDQNSKYKVYCKYKSE